MKVWLYYRLSRDDDPELNSLTNQRNILIDYANKNDLEIVGESSDDNFSGMNFDRPGIRELEKQVAEKTIDGILVKDFSRLGRHRAETDMFIHKLRKKGIWVFSITENLNTFNDEDDLMIGFKGVINDCYARDISKKVRAGINQKQKMGLVILPPMGYRKDPFTKEITIDEEPAEIIKEIFDLCLKGYGFRAIANILNEEKKPPPRYFQETVHNRAQDYDYPEITKRGYWQAKSVKRILENEAYCGTLVNHKYAYSKINGTRGDHPKEEWIRHENYLPAIVSKEKWKRVQNVLEVKRKQQVRSYSNQPCHKYAGLIRCGDCGSVFISKSRKRKNNTCRTEYVCDGYTRYGKAFCSSHRIDEELLDNLIKNQLLMMVSIMEEDYEYVEKTFETWLKDKGRVEQKIVKLNEEYELRKDDQKRILLEKVRDTSRSSVYDEMLESCEKDLEDIAKQIVDLQNTEETIKKRKLENKSSSELLRRMIAEDEFTNTNLRLLVDKIVVNEVDDKLSIRIFLNGNFKTNSLHAGHFLLYESLNGSSKKNGNLTPEKVIASKRAEIA